MTSPAARTCAAALDGVRSLLTIDPCSLGDDDVHDLMLALSRLSDSVAVAQAIAVGEWEARGVWRADGSRSVSLAMSRDTGSSVATARRVLARAHAVPQLPVTVAAVLDGRLSIDHFDAMRAVHERAVSPEWVDRFEQHEPTLVVECASNRLFDDARRSLLEWASVTDDALSIPPSCAESSVSRCRDRVAGTLQLKGDLSPIDAEVVEAELRRLEREVLLDDRRNGVVRTPTQRTAVALVRMAARSQCSAGVSPRPLFQVLVGDERMRHILQLASGAVLSEQQILGHVDTATLETFLFDGPHTIVSVSKRRTFTGALRRAIQVRDRRCQQESVCDVPAIDADVDHLVPAAQQGRTSQFNGRSMCRAHNRLRLGGTKPPPWPERPLDVLDMLRARVRWRMQATPPEEQRAELVQGYLDAINRLFDDESDPWSGLDGVGER